MATSEEANKPEPVTGYPVAYAYAAPPQVVPTNYHQTQYPSRQSGFGSMSPLLCRVIVLVIVIFSIMGVASFATWLILNPQRPEFRIDSASISQLDASSANSSLTAAWHFSLTVKNPNKKLSLVFNTLEATVLYGQWELDTTMIPPFSQERRNETRIDFQETVVSENVDNRVARSIESDKARGEVEFGVVIYGWVRFEAGWWRMRWRFMTVTCNGVKMGLTSNGGTAGNLVGQVGPCRVDM